MRVSSLAAAAAASLLFTAGAHAPASAQAASTTEARPALGARLMTIDPETRAQLLRVEPPEDAPLTLHMNEGLLDSALRARVLENNTLRPVDDLAQPEPPEDVTLYIINGIFAPIEEWPAMVSFRGVAPFGFGAISGEAIHYCGGTMIDAEWVMTAAHCIAEVGVTADDQIVAIPPELDADGLVNHHLFGPIEFVLDTDDLGDDSRAFVRHAIEAYVHPDYEPEIPGVQFPRNDIALLRLDEPWPGGLAAVSVARQRDPAPGAEVWAAGFGALSSAPIDVLSRFTRSPSDTPTSAGSQLLQQVSLDIVAPDVCRAAYPSYDDRTQICAGFREGMFDSCTGDSGGPLAVKFEDGGLYQVGVVSFGRGCAEADSYGVYTRVSAYRNWMTDIVKLSYDANPPKPVLAMERPEAPGSVEPPRAPALTGVPVERIQPELRIDRPVRRVEDD